MERANTDGFHYLRLSTHPQASHVYTCLQAIKILPEIPWMSMILLLCVLFYFLRSILSYNSVNSVEVYLVEAFGEACFS